jgi:GNAT superfamily N-acetyltransferase
MRSPAGWHFEDLARLEYLVTHHFGKDDYYADPKNIAETKGLVIRDEDGVIIAYLLYEEDGVGFHGVRSGVVSTERGKGLGVKIYKRMVAKAKKAGVVYDTYCSRDNVASLNSHVKAGMRVTRISDFVHLST